MQPGEAKFVSKHARLAVGMWLIRADGEETLCRDLGPKQLWDSVSEFMMLASASKAAWKLELVGEQQGGKEALVRDTLLRKLFDEPFEGTISVMGHYTVDESTRQHTLDVEDVGWTHVPQSEGILLTVGGTECVEHRVKVLSGVLRCRRPVYTSSPRD